ncbi:hypothetical protein [Chitinophaga filiformis]|uniref:hypothetical protein n=1 Tax=Chitinophaga filiformis TaxID=104663 RepID=UPI001F2CD335|nr:hypothetical protein [Chitinophaga filiformis]
MRKMSLFLCLLGILSCTKQNERTTSATVGVTSFQSRPPVHTEAVEIYTQCPDPATGIDPVVYTGPQDPQTQTAPGFGIHPNDNYDRGWTDGYRDALFYQNYIGLSTETICNYGLQKGVKDVNSTGTVRWVPENYQLNADEEFTAVRIVSNGCGENWPLKRCVLKNAASSRALLLQYQFNNQYPGRTTAQTDYDRGRLAGYDLGISTQPFSAN